MTAPEPATELGKERIQTGILLTDLGGMDVRALKYLVLYQNTLQKSFEFQFMPDPTEPELQLDPFIQTLDAAVDRQAIRAQGDTYFGKYKKWLETHAEVYGMDAASPDSIVILSIAKLLGNNYLNAGEGWVLIALGNWERYMAPPSIVEFYLMFILHASIRNACSDEYLQAHHSTKGCTFDFNTLLPDARFSVLTGFLCESCWRKIATTTSAQVADDARLLLTKKWIGDGTDPTDVASTARKLGYDLFRTAGISQTLGEKVRAAAEDSIAGTPIRVGEALLVAALLVLLAILGAKLF
jgi:hypothetical protein